MGDAEYNGQSGIWRTVGGRRIFIADGQSLESAMKASGKFPKAKKEDKTSEEPPEKGKWKIKESDELKRVAEMQREELGTDSGYRKAIKRVEECLNKYDNDTVIWIDNHNWRHPYTYESFDKENGVWYSTRGDTSKNAVYSKRGEVDIREAARSIVDFRHQEGEDPSFGVYARKKRG